MDQASKPTSSRGHNKLHLQWKIDGPSENVTFPSCLQEGIQVIAADKSCLVRVKFMCVYLVARERIFHTAQWEILAIFGALPSLHRFDTFFFNFGAIFGHFSK